MIRTGTQVIFVLCFAVRLSYAQQDLLVRPIAMVIESVPV